MPTATNINDYECFMQAHYEVNQAYAFCFFEKQYSEMTKLY